MSLQLPGESWSQRIERNITVAQQRGFLWYTNDVLFDHDLKLAYVARQKSLHQAYLTVCDFPAEGVRWAYLHLNVSRTAFRFTEEDANVLDQLAWQYLDAPHLAGSGLFKNPTHTDMTWECTNIPGDRAIGLASSIVEWLRSREIVSTWDCSPSGNSYVF